MLHATHGTVARLRQDVTHLVDPQVAVVVHGSGPQELVEPHVDGLDLGGARRCGILGIRVATSGDPCTQVREEPGSPTTPTARGARDQHHRGCGGEGNEGPHEHREHDSSMRAEFRSPGRDPRLTAEPHTTFTPVGRSVRPDRAQYLARQAETSSRIRWLMTVVTPSPRIVTP